MGLDLEKNNKKYIYNRGFQQSNQPEFSVKKNCIFIKQKRKKKK